MNVSYDAVLNDGSKKRLALASLFVKHQHTFRFAHRVCPEQDECLWHPLHPETTAIDTEGFTWTASPGQRKLGDGEKMSIKRGATIPFSFLMDSWDFRMYAVNGAFSMACFWASGEDPLVVKRRPYSCCSVCAVLLCRVGGVMGQRLWERS
jgi:hypothetical protein